MVQELPCLGPVRFVIECGRFGTEAARRAEDCGRCCVCVCDSLSRLMMFAVLVEMGDVVSCFQVNNLISFSCPGVGRITSLFITMTSLLPNKRTSYRYTHRRRWVGPTAPCVWRHTTSDITFPPPDRRTRRRACRRSRSPSTRCSRGSARAARTCRPTWDRT